MEIAVYESILTSNPDHAQSIQSLKNIFLDHQKYEKGINFLNPTFTKSS